MGFISGFVFPDIGIWDRPRQGEGYHFLLPAKGQECREGSLVDSEEFGYSYRFVCFMDMLGCKKLVWESEASQAAFEKVKKIASVFEEEHKKYVANHWCNGFTFSVPKNGRIKDYRLAEEDIKVDMSMFSDSIIISYELSDSSLFLDWYRRIFQVFNDLCRLQFGFAVKGIFLRGGLTYGKIYHRGNVCFGPALINSVMLESKHARYPCIAVDKAIVGKIQDDMKSDLEDDYAPGYKYPHKLRKFAEELFCDYLLRTDNCNRVSDEQPVFMLDWLSSRFIQSPSNIPRIRSAILAELEKGHEEPIAEKYRWLVRYFNQAIFFEEGHDDMKIGVDRRLSESVSPGATD